MELNRNKLGIADYVILASLFIACSAIGIYYGFFKRKISRTHYIFGNRTMSVIPVAMSLCASMFTSSVYLGRATEVYLYGMNIIYMDIASIFMYIIFFVFYLPVLYNLQTKTLYEYLLLRFDRNVHILGTALFVLESIFLSPIILYIPALMFNQVTGVNQHLVTVITCFICIFYTCVGGFPAVIWTDLIQAIVILAALLTVSIKGTLLTGGLNFIWEKNYESGRLELPNLNLDFTHRHNIWGMIIGFYPILFNSNCLNQMAFQRFRSVPTLKSAKRAMVIFFILSRSIIVIASCSGLLLYATYYDCDPFSAHIIDRYDKTLPYLYTSVLKDIPGIQGLFLAGILSAGLSTLSTILNTLPGIFLQDFYISLLKRNMPKNNGDCFVKVCVIILGIISIALTLIVEKVETLYQVSTTIFGITNGPVLAIFTIGIFLPSVKGKAVLIGTLFGLCVVFWIFIGSLFTHSKEIYETKPLSTKGCTFNITSHIITTPRKMENNSTTVAAAGEDVFVLYRISFFWYSFISFIITMVVTCISSIFMDKNDVNSMDASLLSPLVIKHQKRNTEEEAAVEMKLIDISNKLSNS